MPVIAISGMPGTGCTTIGKIVAKKLNIKSYDPGTYAKKEYSGKNQTEKVTKFWENCDESFHKQMDAMQKKLADKGDIVISGKLSVHMIESDLSVWLEAPSIVRAKRTAKRDNIPVEELHEKLLAREKKERHYWQELYGFDYFDQEDEVDLVIDTTELTKEEIANQIVRRANR